MFYQTAGNLDWETAAKLIADIAIVFHWSLSEMMEMEPRELLFWQKQAAERYKTK
ncbi:GpE family phage tail protein [Bartonella krasnovii]|uniref:GpE family phage tail protein n=1 Tax=Bartonella krasnovii TaxID=2267275 RepID=UPI0030C6D4D7